MYGPGNTGFTAAFLGLSEMQHVTYALQGVPA